MTPPRASRSSPLSAACRTLAIATIALAAGLAGAAGASAAGLFEPLPAAEAASVDAPAASLFASRDRLMQIDYAYMESRLAPRGIDKARDRLDSTPAATRLQLELFPGLDLTLVRNALRKADLGGYVWDGRIRGQPGYALFIVSDDQVTGQIQFGTRLFEISPVSGGVHRVSEIDPARFPPEDAITAPVQPSRVSPPEHARPQGKTRVKVLVPFTRKAKKQAGNIRQKAKLAISLANKAARKAGAKVRYKLAATMKVRGYREKSFRKDLNKLTKGKGPFRKVHKKRNRKNADLVALLRKSSKTYCGLGWYIENPANSTANYGFTVSAHGCVSNHTVAHEMGHNSGLEHDRYQIKQVTGSNPPRSKFNFGYSNVKAEIISVMAYQTKCLDKNNAYCTRVPMFSSTKKRYEGDKLGKRWGRKKADARRRLNQTRAAIASYR